MTTAADRTFPVDPAHRECTLSFRCRGDLVARVDAHARRISTPYHRADRSEALRALLKVALKLAEEEERRAQAPEAKPARATGRKATRGASR